MNKYYINRKSGCIVELLGYLENKYSKEVVIQKDIEDGNKETLEIKRYDDFLWEYEEINEVQTLIPTDELFSFYEPIKVRTYKKDNI